jgi:hypothetical protein
MVRKLLEDSSLLESVCIVIGIVVPNSLKDPSVFIFTGR